MKEWKESDWFKNWLAIARQGQNAMRRAEGFSEIPQPLMERQASPDAECGQPVSTPQWQVTE
jgi:hypothetical protein